MNIFDFRHRLVEDYADYITSFIQIQDQKIKEYVCQRLSAGVLWPEPLLQLNPSFEPGEWIDKLVSQNLLHAECSRIFRIKKNEFQGEGRPLQLHKHQLEAIRTAQAIFLG